MYRLGNKKLEIPLIQGGMGVGISLGNLAGNVANNGAMGNISMVNIGFREGDFYKNPRMANKRAFIKELERAKHISQGKGIVGVNLMQAMEDFDNLTEFVATTDIDAITVGAGLPMDLPKYFVDSDILLGFIVSSLRALRLILKNWARKYGRKPDFVVYESSQAGGHLGFSKEDVDKEVSVYAGSLDLIEDLRASGIKLFLAGGINGPEDLIRARDLGAYGVQMGTRFIASHEADCPLEFKQAIINAKEEDLVLFKSPAGLWGRAIKNPLIDRIDRERLPPQFCMKCLKTCKPNETRFCISQALINSANGKVDQGIIFSGTRVSEFNELVHVKDIIDGMKEGL